MPRNPQEEASSEATPAPAPSADAKTDTRADTAPEPEARLDFLFFFPDSGPDPAPGASDGPEFLEWVKQTELQRVAVVGSTGVTNTLFVELWDRAFTTRHKGAKYRLTGPETFTGVTNSQGRLEHTDVLPGDYTLTLTLAYLEGTDEVTEDYSATVLVLRPAANPQRRALGDAREYPTRRALIYRVDQYYRTQRTFIPRTIVNEFGRVLDSLDVLADFLVALPNFPDFEQVVCGHCDPSGTKSINSELSLARATSMQGFLMNNRDTWLTELEQDDQDAAARVLFAWVSDRIGWDVHTGTEPPDVIPEWNERCDEALVNYRSNVEQHLAVPVGAAERMERADWDAAFTLMEQGLLASLHGDEEQLNQLRAKLAITELFNCGDKFPRLVGSAPEEQRRTELVLLEPGPGPKPESNFVGSRVYDAYYQLELVPSRLRADLRLELRTAEGLPLRALPYALTAGSLTSKGKSTAEGHLLRPRVESGEFEVDFHDPEKLLAYNLVQAIHVAFEANEPAGFIPPLNLAMGVKELLADVYTDAFGRNLLDDITQVASGSPFDDLVFAYLAKLELKPDPRFVFHSYVLKEESDE